MRPNVVTFRLDCGHSLTGDARFLVWMCYQGGAHRAIVSDVLTIEWHAKCLECNFARWCGQSEHLAKETVRKHRLKHAKCVSLLEVNPASARIRLQLVKLGVIQDVS